MSMMERVKGIWNGVKTGVYVPLITPFAIGFMFTGKTGGSGAGPALACFFGAVAVVIGGIFLAGAVPLAAWLNVFGIPWFLTVPLAYFAFWGILGFCWKMK
jgi:hypothetical protein